jgi:hypothetical protein
MDLIAKLQRAGALDVSIDETHIAGKAVDQMLVELARQMSAMVVTNDFVLARVAQIQNVPILNINQLANALKPAFVPGESLRLLIQRHGEQQGQGVGFLEDGTMVVAEDGAALIGQEAVLTVSSVLQTNAGRLVFARVSPESLPSGGGPAPLLDVPPPATPAAPAPTDPAEAPRAGGEDASRAPEADPAGAANEISKPRGPFPPKPPRSIRTGTPRNPRR